MKELISSFKILHTLTKNNIKLFFILIISLVETFLDIAFFYTFYRTIKILLVEESQYISLRFLGEEYFFSFQILLSILCVFFIIRSLLTYWINIYIFRKAFSFYKEICAHFYKVFLLSPRHKIDLIEDHEILTFFLTDLRRTITGCFPSMLFFLRSLILIFTLICYLVTTNSQNIFVIFSVIFSVLIFLFIFKNDIFVKTSDKLREYNTAMNKFGPFVLKFFKEIRIFNKEKLFFEKFKNTVSQMVNMDMVSNKISFGLKTFIEISFFFTTIIYFIYLVNFKNIDNSIVIFANLFAVMIRVTPVFNTTLRCYSDIKIRRANIIKTESYLNKFPISLSKENIETSKIKKFEINKFEIKDLNFKNKNSKEIFKKCFFKFNESDKILITGPSGSGKTTLLDILSGINNEYQGNIYLNGELISKSEISKILKNSVGYVSQPSYLMPGTIKENITLTFEDKLIDKNKLELAIERSGLDKELNKFSNGIETYLTTPMQNISEGQKQRIFISRCIYFDRKIILFDEATSGLDSESEKMILKTLLNQPSLTIIVVSHNIDRLPEFNHAYKIENKEILSEKT